MKILVVLLTIFSLSSTVSFAAKKKRKGGKYGPAGCGLGAMIFKGKSGMMFNVMAATTNGSGNQTFGMTTGTLGCDGDDKVAAVSFIQNNRVALQNDVARGEGETLSAYLELIQTEQPNVAALKSNYSKIFTTESDAEQIYSNINAYL
ncbi:MAG: DUF3015 family protein [Halobacteriovoraceae bacterium]|nr:DUF3015 family protein [Halobacteriovoraceae bacterium]